MNIIKGLLPWRGNFCIVPCPWRIWDDTSRKQMLAMLPVLGLLMGALWYGLAELLLWLCIPKNAECGGSDGVSVFCFRVYAP